MGTTGAKNPDTHIRWGRGFLRSCDVATYGCGSACAGGLGVGGKPEQLVVRRKPLASARAVRVYGPQVPKAMVQL